MRRDQKRRAFEELCRRHGSGFEVMMAAGVGYPEAFVNTLKAPDAEMRSMNAIRDSVGNAQGSDKETGILDMTNHSHEGLQDWRD